MPKFREWRSRPSNREAVSKQRFQRCRECRDWFEPLLSSKEQSCSRCTKRNSRVNETEGEASNLRFIPVRDCRHPAPRQDTSNSVSSPGLGQHTPYRRPAPESDNSRERPTGSQSRGHRLPVNHVKKRPETVDVIPLGDEIGMTDANVSNGVPPGPTRGNRSFIFQRVDNDPTQLLDKAVNQKPNAESTRLHQVQVASFSQRTSIRSRDPSSIVGQQVAKLSVCTQTDTPPQPPKTDASVQVDLIPQFLFNLLQEQSESSTSLEVLGGKEQVVKQFETEITAISSDPTLLELVATRTELLSDLEKLKLKLSMEKSRLASKKRAMIATGQEAKRLLHVINASRRECEIHRGNIQVADGLVFRSRHHLQHYEDQVALTKHQLLNEKDQELAGILKNTLAKRERRVAIAKCDLQRNIHQRASAHSDLRDAEQYLRDKEDNFKLWWSRAKRDETEWHVNSAGLVAVEKEAAFIRSQIFSVEQKSATKILDLIEKREALLNYKHQQVLRNLLLEKQHYVKLILSDQTEKELNS